MVKTLSVQIRRLEKELQGMESQVEKSKMWAWEADEALLVEEEKNIQLLQKLKALEAQEKDFAQREADQTHAMYFHDLQEQIFHVQAAMSKVSCIERHYL